jgi:heat shock protein HtpX
MYEEIARNKRNSAILIAVFVAAVVFLGYLFGTALDAGFFGVAIACVLAPATALVGYFQGDKIVLAVSRAQEADRENYPILYNVTEELTVASGLPMPKLYVIPDEDAPNAFATGRDPAHSSLAVTAALLGRLHRDQLQGVLAHEMSHVGDYDIRFATLVGILVGMVAMMSDFFLRSAFWSRGRSRSRSNSGGGAVILIISLVLAILAPLFAKLVQLAISRQREYLADAQAAKMTRNPEGLASALEEISRSPGQLEAANRATAHLYIVSPLQANAIGKKASGLFSTHPPIEERIKRLRAIA